MQFYAITTFPPAILSKLIQLLQAADLTGKPKKKSRYLHKGEHSFHQQGSYRSKNVKRIASLLVKRNFLCTTRHAQDPELLPAVRFSPTIPPKQVLGESNASFSAASSADPNKHLQLTEIKSGNLEVLLFGLFFKCSPFTKQATT